ncbi:MAG: TrkH family potassium uptake protein [Succinivibrionaceae bacterium]|nr:TrkH family potassium uptake protein [Succinivibrionaceae bacterium]
MDALRINSILFIVGASTSKVVTLMLIPFLYALCTETSGYIEFLSASMIAAVPTIFFMRPGVKTSFEFQTKDIFLITCIIWIVDSTFAAMPFYFMLDCNYTDAFFETISGLTTFGGTVFSNLDQLPQSILLWRSMLQWIGGVGFVVIAVALLPKLNVGGMKLFQSEASEKNKDTPKATTIAKNIIIVYIILTVLCFASFCMCGMSVFDAICHAFTTTATGGFSTHDDSMLHFTPEAQWTCILFMLAGSLPFMLFVKSFKRHNPMVVVRNQQVGGYLRCIILMSFILALILLISQKFGAEEAVRYAVFNVVSIITTSGFSLGEWYTWGAVAGLILLILLPIGGCSGSTSGGIKFFRIQIIDILFRRQCQELLHPNAVVAQMYQGHSIDDALIRSVVAFLLSYVFLLIVSSIVLATQNVDLMVAITSSMSAISNVGPSFGNPDVAMGSYGQLTSISKWMLCFDMLCGRVEILTVMVLIVPMFWRIGAK